MKKRTLSLDELAKMTTKMNLRTLTPIFQEIDEMGGVVFLVGGAVRDLLLDRPLKDLDLEVHQLSMEELKTILNRYGEVNDVGKSFGVLKFRATLDTSEMDWSLPRGDSFGRKPKVTIDQSMGIEEALIRRDLTINAMALNMVTNELYDPFDGEEDLKKEVLRCLDKKLFIEDPLRFFRVMQFIGRFQFQTDEVLDHVCSTMDISNISKERIEEEMKKLLLTSREPSVAFRWVKRIGRIQEVFPELSKLEEVPQSPRYHPEGDAFQHTMQVLDAAAEICERMQDKKQKLILMYAALCHDVGKANSTVVHDDGKVTSYNHEMEGVEVTDQFLKRFCSNKEIISAVKKLVRYHMEPVQLLKNHAKPNAYKRLALKLAPEANGEMLAWLLEADKRGRNVQGKPLSGPVVEVTSFLEKMRSINVSINPENALLTGKDFLDTVKPGPKLGHLVKRAYEIQIEEGILDRELLKKKVLAQENGY